MRTCVAFAVLASIAAGAGAQNSKPADVWFSAGHVALAASAPAGAIAAEWQFDRADNGDVRLAKKERRGNADVSGVVLSVCGDQALLLKDIVPAPRRELQELNEPVLYLQLALRLLARAMPDGLPVAGSETAIDLGDEKITLRLRKGYSARKDIGAPWRARGVARRSATDVRFEFLITHTGDEPPHRQSELKLSGVWQQQTRMPRLDNAYNLTGWRVHRVDTVAEIVGGNTVFDAVARTTSLSFATLGDVRASIGRGWDPNVKAAQRTECKV
jgi:hypothetical protein